MTIESPRPVLKGKKALVAGIANEHSIAYGCAMAFHELEADLAITYLNEKSRPYVDPATTSWGRSRRHWKPGRLISSSWTPPINLAAGDRSLPERPGWCRHRSQRADSATKSNRLGPRRTGSADVGGPAGGNSRDRIDRAPKTKKAGRPARPRSSATRQLSRPLPQSAEAFSGWSTSCTRAIGAASPARLPIFRMRR